jgi:hypothetical protein
MAEQLDELSRRRWLWFASITRRHVGWLLAILVLALTIWFSPTVQWFVENVVYARHKARALEFVESLAKRRPSDVSPEVWEVAEFWIVTSFHNVFFSPEHVPIAELDRFAADVETALQSEVTLETVDWYWRRIANSGPADKRYFDRFEPEYREYVEFLVAKPVNQNAE